MRFGIVLDYSNLLEINAQRTLQNRHYTKINANSFQPQSINKNKCLLGPSGEMKSIYAKQFTFFFFNKFNFIQDEIVVLIQNFWIYFNTGCLVWKRRILYENGGFCVKKEHLVEERSILCETHNFVKNGTFNSKTWGIWYENELKFH